MLLTYERGDAQRPKGHALLYFRSWTDPNSIFATYLIVPPIAVEISKYIPPMFAGQLQQMGMGTGGIAVFPYPPIPEKVESQAYLQRLAEARDDDLIFGGSADTSAPDRMLHAAAEAAQQYLQSYTTHIESLASTPEPELMIEESGSVDVNEVLYGLMGERDRLAELAKLSGQLRYAVAGRDTHLIEDTVAEIQRLGKYLPEKYKAEEILQAARRPGAEGDRLAQLYLDRAYKLANEDYEGLQELEEEIRRLKG
ncbi:MAG: hypothetical protein ACM3US_05160 [Sphingomonadaceae bacterium]